MKTIAITGVLGYSGRYIAREAAKQGWRVIGLTNSAGRLPNDEGRELRPMPWSTQEEVLSDVDVLVNTYWVRFSYAGGRHAAFSHEEAVRNTKALFSAAQRSGVRRIVHTSITCPDATSPLPYFRGKAELETALEATGIPHSILRPAVLFGDSPQESILINNIAWSLRHLPAVATFGWGNYQLQPLHVQDFAEAALREAGQEEQHRIIHATGTETYSFRALWKLLAEAMLLDVSYNTGKTECRLMPYLPYKLTGVITYYEKDEPRLWLADVYENAEIEFSDVFIIYNEGTDFKDLNFEPMGKGEIRNIAAEAGLDPERVNGIILPGADAVFRECGQCNVVMDIKLLKDNGAEAEDLPEFYIK